MAIKSLIDSDKKTLLVLGAGKDQYTDEEYEHVYHLDKLKLPHIQITADLDNPKWKYCMIASNSIHDHFHRDASSNLFDCIVAEHVLEHVKDLVQVLEGCWSLLKPQGVLEIEAPWGPTQLARLDPTHVRFFEYESFDYFDPSTHLGSRFGLLPEKPFKILIKKFRNNPYRPQEPVLYWKLQKESLNGKTV